MDFWNRRINILVFVFIYLQTASAQEELLAPVERYKDNCFDVRMSIVFEKNNTNYPVNPEGTDRFDAYCDGNDAQDIRLRIKLSPDSISSSTAEPSSTDSSTLDSTITQPPDTNVTATTNTDPSSPSTNIAGNLDPETNSTESTTSNSTVTDSSTSDSTVIDSSTSDSTVIDSSTSDSTVIDSSTSDSTSTESSDPTPEYIDFIVKNLNGTFIVHTIDVQWKSEGIVGILGDLQLFNSSGKFLCNSNVTLSNAANKSETEDWTMIMNAVEFWADAKNPPPKKIDICEGYVDIKKPEPETAVYSSIDLSGCLRAELGFQIVVKYVTKTGADKYATVVVPEGADVNVSSDCRQVSMKWTPGNKKSSWFDKIFHHRNARADPEKENSLTFTINNDNSMFSIENLKTELYLKNDPLFENPAESEMNIEISRKIVNISNTTNFICKTGEEFVADDGITYIRMNSKLLTAATNPVNLKVCEADNTGNGGDEGEVLEESSNKTLAIALGTIAGVAVVAGIGGYILHRRKKSRKQGVA